MPQVPPARGRTTADRLQARHRSPVRRRQQRRLQALAAGLLGAALSLAALSMPAAAGAIGGTAPAALDRAAVQARHVAATQAGGAPPSSAPAAAPLVAAPLVAAPLVSAPVPPPGAPAVTIPAQAPPAATTATHPPVLAGAPAPADAGAEAQVLALVNQQRAAAGCAPLTANSALADLARAHSADMRDRGYFAHNTPAGRSPFDRADAAGITTMRAENIAMGQATAADVMAAWMASPGHRANILDCQLRTLGVGVAYGAGGPWWTQDFGV